MAKSDTMYLANLSFLLDYTDGTTNDEIESEIYKVAFQNKEDVHYDRGIGGNFIDLEQEPSNLSTGLIFAANMIESIYTVNVEKENNPYIIMGYSDIEINDETYKDDGYLVQIRYRLLKDMNVEGTVTL